MSEQGENSDTLSDLYYDADVMLVCFRSHSVLAALKDELGRDVEKEEPIGELNETLKNLPPNCVVRVVTNNTVETLEGDTGLKGAQMMVEYVKQLRDNPNIVNVINNKDLDTESDRRLGDVFEYTDFAGGQSVKPFLSTLKASKYGGINRTFWYDYIRDNLPQDVREALVVAGGKSATEKAIDTVDWLMDQIKTFNSSLGQKQVVVAIAYEEVIETLTYQVAAYLHASQTEDLDKINELAEVYFDYKEGPDLHVSMDNVLVFDVKGLYIAIELEKFALFLKNQQNQ